jgi:hypothetical protein
VADLAPCLFDFPERGPGAETTRRLNARVMHASPGPIDVDAVADDRDGWIGLLVLDGVLMVELEVGRARTGWLIGADDLVRPWDMGEISLTERTRWRALTPASVALLDPEFSLRAGGIPMLARTLVARTARTTNWLMAKSLILASPIVEERLLLAFALLGERWGIVTHEGVVLKLPLTHALLAALCGVRRPSVTIAAGSLEAAGILTRIGDGAWLLRRQVSEEPARRPACWPQYATALGLGENAAAG